MTTVTEYFNRKKFMSGIGKRVDEIIQNSKNTRYIHIVIHADMETVPTIFYEVEEIAKGEKHD